MTLKDFIEKYTGVRCGNTNGNFGECVGLTMLWVQNLGLSHIWGNAKDVYKNASTKEWDKISNEPSFYPSAGDVIVWDGTMGLGWGHIAIVTASSKTDDSFTVFEQNNPIGSAPLIKTYKNWNGVIGWLHPLVLNEEETAPSILETDIPTEVEDTFGLKKIKRYNKNWTYGDFVQDWADMVDELAELDSRLAQEALEYKEKYKVLESNILGLETKVVGLEGTLKTEMQKYSDLLSRYDRVFGKVAEWETLCQIKDKEIATLKENLATLPNDGELHERVATLEAEKLALLTKSFDDWLKNQDLKTKLVFILDILRSVIYK
jgi:hypothetical protein